jgi:hypothetical protein
MSASAMACTLCIHHGCGGKGVTTGSRHQASGSGPFHLLAWGTSAFQLPAVGKVGHLWCCRIAWVHGERSSRLLGAGLCCGPAASAAPCCQGSLKDAQEGPAYQSGALLQQGRRMLFEVECLLPLAYSDQGSGVTCVVLLRRSLLLCCTSLPRRVPNTHPAPAVETAATHYCLQLQLRAHALLAVSCLVLALSVCLVWPQPVWAVWGGWSAFVGLYG